MNTVTITKKEYETLRAESDLYQMLIRKVPVKKWGIEIYAPDRIREFAREDKINQKTAVRIRKVLKRK